MKRLAMAVVLLSAGWLSAGGDAKNVEVVSIKIAKQQAKDNDLNPFDKGTALELIVAQPGKRILGLDANASKLEKFTDDKNTDLAKDDKNSFDRWVSDFGSRTGKDGTRILFTARAGGVPAPGATKIHLKGTVVLKVGSDEKTVEEKKLVLKGDAKVKVGPFEARLGKGFGGDDETYVEIVHSERNLKSVTFLDKDGKEMKTERAGDGSFSDGMTTIYMSSFSFKGKAAEFGVRIIYFGKVETVTVPLDLQVGVGF